MKKQSAVEWLIEQIKKGIDSEDGSISINWLYDETIAQAKEMEKQTILDTYRSGKVNSFDVMNIGAVNITAEQYYNETFKSE